MKLKKLYLDGFGHFHKYAIDDISGTLTVFYGPNEAGKSTLLAFVRGILFGFPHRLASHYPALAGGKHGGRIAISDSEGAIHTVERFSRTLNVTGPNGREADPQAALTRLTGGIITQSHFKNIFAFSLDELQSDDTLDDSNIHSAGQGVPGLPALLGSLEDEKRKIYHSQGRKKTLIGSILDELCSVEKSLKELEGRAADYGSASARQKELDAELKDVNDMLMQTRTELSYTDKLKEGWSSWVGLENAKKQLEGIPSFDRFPDDSIPRLDAIGRQIRQAESDRNDAEEELRLAETDASIGVRDEDMLPDGDRIEQIRRDRGKFDSAARDLSECQAELQNLEKNLTDRLGALGGDWSESNLHEIDRSAAAKEQVGEHDGQLKRAEEAARNARSNLDEAGNKMNELLAKKQDHQNRMRVDSEGRECTYLENLLGQRDSLGRLQGWETGIENSVHEMSRRQGELDSQRAGMEKVLSDLGRDWNLDRLDAFETSIESRQQVEDFKRRLADAGEAARLSGTLLEQARAGLAECQNVLREAQEQMPDAAPVTESEIASQRTALRTSRSRFDEYERERINHQNLIGQLDALTGGRAAGSAQSRLAPLLLGLAGTLAASVGAYLGDSALALGVVGGAVLLGTAAYLFARRRNSGGTAESAILSRQAAEAKSRTDAAHASLEDAAGPLGMDELSSSALDAAGERLDSSERAHSAWKEAHGRVLDAQRTLKSQETRAEEASRKSKSDAESESAVQSEWLEWLARRGLSDSMMPDTVIELTVRIKEAKSALKQIKDMEERITKSRRDVDEYHGLVKGLAELCGIPFDGTDHQNARSVAARLVKEFDRADRIADNILDVDSQMEQHAPAHDRIATEERKAAGNLASARDGWRNWLLEHNFRDDFTPGAVLEFMAAADAANAALDAANSMRARVGRMQNSVDEFVGRVDALAMAHNVRQDGTDGTQVTGMADQLIGRLEAAREESAKSRAAIQKRDDLTRRFDVCRSKLESAENELAALLKEAGARDVEDLRSRADQHGKRMELERQRDEHDRALALLGGPAEGKDRFLESLAASDSSRLDAEHARLKDDEVRLERTRSELEEERGRINSQLDHMAAEEESSVLRNRRNVLKARLLGHATEWSRLVLAKTLLEMTQKKFEQERQPAVVRHAREFFSHITNNRYRGLYAPISEKRIMVVDGNGNTKQPHELSRGTREQLYLALRFGLIRDLGERTERLPVIIDEILVNFDPDRARLAAQSLGQLSRTNQVLVFTCHPNVRDMFVDVAGAKIVNIRND